MLVAYVHDVHELVMEEQADEVHRGTGKSMGDAAT